MDRFGQYNWVDWPGKLHAEAEWPVRIAAEQADLAAHPAPNDLDEYGGWTNGPQLEATGSFRVEQVAGKWWLVTPGGHLFFSMGMDCVRWHNDTILERRDAWLEWKPTPESEFKPFFGRIGRVVIGNVKEGATFNFYGANLLRKYGPEWQAKWRDTTLARLRSWGFNTIANWSDPDVYRGAKVAHVVTTGVGGNHRRLASGADYWGLMHDPFDPQFAVDARQAVDAVAPLIRDNPWCIGLFVDNELSWGSTESRGLALGALNAAADQPAKLALLEDLKRKYETVDRLNDAWGTTCASWEAILAEKSAPKSLTPACKADLDAFLFSLAKQYFAVVRDAVKAVSPRTLYLGCRFAWSSQAAIRAAAEVCDVVSFNIYQRRLDPGRWGFTSTLGKPCIIGEFHFGALDRGMFHTGLVPTKDQADRAQHYIDYLHSVADLPAFVGCHWFQYLDQPCTGRTLDGENYNIGFVTMSDTPYPEMVAAARQVHGEILARRYGAGG
ncbi:MAG: beta-galactosidase [Armatimonadetes bacterium]|nr:beta-galactosidase [Armatimonadota bacterium]